MAKGDVILPSNLQSARNSSFDVSMIAPGSTRSPDHITPQEIVSLVDSARQKTSKLNRKIKNSTFQGFYERSKGRKAN